MQEIKGERQESRARSSKKLFGIAWTESVHWYALVEAENKEEARQVWENGPEKFWLKIDSDGQEITSEPTIEEKLDVSAHEKAMAVKAKGGDNHES